MKTPLKVASITCSFFVLLLLSAAHGDERPLAAADGLPGPQLEIPLYPGAAPGSESWNWEERLVNPPPAPPVVQNVVRPVLLYYPADKAKAVGTTMIVVPGGGFRALMMSYEGVDIARRLNQMGVDAFVLKYRLTYTGPKATANQQKRSASTEQPQHGQDIRELAAADGRQAVRLLRHNAAMYDVRPDRIGMIGFSAGGYVTVAAVMGPADGRPDFAAPIYTSVGHLLEQSPTPPAGAPPLFIAVAADDQMVGYENSVALYSAWRSAEIPVELHVFQTGRHGFLKKGGGADHFMDRLEEWLNVNGWLTKTID